MTERFTLEIVFEGIDKLSGTADRASRSLSGFSKGLQSAGKAALVGLGAVGAIGAGAAVGIGKLASEAAGVENVRQAFVATADDIGVSSDKLLSDMKATSGGMISNADAMRNINLAAQLVGNDFAKTLPESMQYLQKVSASTGEDMGFLTDSLTRGIGRLSPLILDNLGIQVDLTKAYEDYGRSMGVADSELAAFVKGMSKSEQQAALTTQVMGMLEENTAHLPDVADSAATRWAALQVTLKDLGVEVGSAFLPLFEQVIDVVSRLADKALPVLRSWLGQINSSLENAQPLWDTLAQAWAWASEKATALWQALEPILAPIGQFISQNVTLKDVLIGLGIAIASVLVPAMVSLAGSVLAATWPVLAVIAAVAALRAAWESDFLGIRTALENAWAAIQPVFETIRGWLSQSIPEATNTLNTAWQTVTTAISDAWQNVFLPALQAVWGFLQDSIFPLFDALLNVWIAGIQFEIEVLSALWENVLLPALRKVWDYIDKNVLPLLRALWEFIKQTLGPVLKWLGEQVLDNLKRGFDGVKNAIGWVIDKANTFASVIRNIQLPDWLQRHSPSPFEQTLMGIRDTMGEITRYSLPKFQAELNMAGGASLAGMGAGGVTNNNRVLAPVVLQSGDVMDANGDIDWTRLAEYLQGRS